MESSGSPKRLRRSAAELPDNVIHAILCKLDFKSSLIAAQVCKKWDELLKAGLLPENVMLAILSKLDFKSKLMAGQVCKSWDELLKAGDVGARHWEVDYNINSLVSSPALKTTDTTVSSGEQFNSTIGRWFINRAAAIKKVHVCGILSVEPRGVAAMDLLERHLPLLAGYLSVHVNPMELSFIKRSPFESPLLSSPAFLTLLCPMVTSLRLFNIKAAISRAQFAAICQLSNLTELHIQRVSLETKAFERSDEEGLEEVTADIGKLVNLKSLVLGIHARTATHMPDEISCLQKLEDFVICDGHIKDLPAGLAMLPNLASLRIMYSINFRSFPCLQGLTSLASVELNMCELDMIPEALADLSGLTSLDVSCNSFQSHEGRTWWPATMTRLTKLADLKLSCLDIHCLPPDISAFTLLTKLDINGNFVGSLPEELSSLQNLKVLVLEANKFPEVPVSVLSHMTALNTINMSYNGPDSEGEYVALRVSSPLLPILHPGLVRLDLRQAALEASGRPVRHKWDPVSSYHLGRAMAEVANRRPLPTLVFEA